MEAANKREKEAKASQPPARSLRSRPKAPRRTISGDFTFDEDF